MKTAIFPLLTVEQCLPLVVPAVPSQGPDAAAEHPALMLDELPSPPAPSFQPEAWHGWNGNDMYTVWLRADHYNRQRGWTTGYTTGYC